MGAKTLSGRKWVYAVTFEKPESKAPETLRGTVCAGSAATACARAVREASKARVGSTWDDIVVLLEKVVEPAQP